MVDLRVLGPYGGFVPLGVNNIKFRSSMYKELRVRFLIFCVKFLKMFEDM